MPSPVSPAAMSVTFWTWYLRAVTRLRRSSRTSLPLGHMRREQSMSVYPGSQTHMRTLPESQLGIWGTLAAPTPMPASL